MDPTDSPSPPKATLSDPQLDAPDDDETPVQITIKFPPEHHNQTWDFTSSDTFSDLTSALSLEFPSYDWSKSKALLELKGKRPSGLKAIYTPSSDSSVPLSTLHTTTLRFLAPQTTALTALKEQSQTAATWRAKRALARARYARLPPSHKPSSSSSKPTISSLSSPSTQYTFQTLRPLPHLPNPQHAHALLHRLSTDPGIVHVMSTHKFSVTLLTEMDPIAHTSTTHEGVTRILGLNRNKGEVIELRLRTDAYDGWRDYKTIRKTLCHELTHNIHSEHDAEFWKLCRQIEREVEKADWKYSGGGQMVGGPGTEFAPERGGGEEEEDGLVMDLGGWIGGSYVLGGGGGVGGLSAREVRARAAEARWSRLERATREAEKEAEKGEGEAGEEE